MYKKRTTIDEGNLSLEWKLKSQFQKLFFSNFLFGILTAKSNHPNPHSSKHQYIYLTQIWFGECNL